MLLGATVGGLSGALVAAGTLELTDDSGGSPASKPALRQAPAVLRVDATNLPMVELGDSDQV